MSKYTTEVRFICETNAGLSESVGYNDLDTVLTTAIPKIFNFPFPIFDESYRTVLERKILKHYYTREICEETVGLWKLRLDTRLNEIMPYYNQLYKSELLEFNPLYAVDLTTNRTTDLDSKRTENESISDSGSESNSIENSVGRITDATDSTIATGTDNTSETGSISSTVNSTENVDEDTTTNNTNRDLYSDTPQGSLVNVENETYLTNARKITNAGTGTADRETTVESNNESESTNTIQNTTRNENNNTKHGTMSEVGNVEESKSNTYSRTRGNNDNLLSTEDYLEHVYGFNGKGGSEMLLKYRETFLNIDVMVINELEDLFFGLW